MLFYLKQTTMKKCIKCGEVKSLDSFHAKKSAKDGKSHRCKSCVSEQRKEYYIKNKEKRKEKSKEYYIKNKEKRKEYRENHYSKNKGYYAEKSKEYHIKNKEKISNKGKEYREKNKEKISEQRKEYREKNKERISNVTKEYRKKNRHKFRGWGKKEYRNNPLFKIRCNIKNSINNSLKNKGHEKNTRTHDILKCSYSFFQGWLYSVSKVNPSISEVHIDHVIPVSLANTENEVLELNHFSNFQWLSKEDNLKKGNRFVESEKLDRVLSNHPNPKILELIINRTQLNVV